MAYLIPKYKDTIIAYTASDHHGVVKIKGIPDIPRKIVYIPYNSLSSNQIIDLNKIEVKEIHTKNEKGQVVRSFDITLDESFPSNTNCAYRLYYTEAVPEYKVMENVEPSVIEGDSELDQFIEQNWKAPGYTAQLGVMDIVGTIMPEGIVMIQNLPVLPEALFVKHSFSRIAMSKKSTYQQVDLKKAKYNPHTNTLIFNVDIKPTRMMSVIFTAIHHNKLYTQGMSEIETHEFF